MKIQLVNYNSKDKNLNFEQLLNKIKFIFRHSDSNMMKKTKLLCVLIPETPGQAKAVCMQNFVPHRFTQLP